MAKKIDANTPEILSALHGIGWLSEDTHELGRGFPDLLALCPNPAGGWLIMLVEIKSPRGRLTQDEIAFQKRYPRLVHVWRTAQDVIEDCRIGGKK